MADDENKWRRRGKAVRTEGIALMLPMVMVIYPVGAGLAGRYLAERYGMPWITIVAVAVGIAGGVWECRRLLKQLNDAGKK